MGEQSRKRAWLAACLLVGLVLRVGVAAMPHLAGSLSVSGQPLRRWANQALFPDTVEYTRIAHNLRHGLGLGLDSASQVGRMPGYPVLLAAVQAIFGERLLAARLVDALVGTATIALVFLLGREVYGEAEGLAAAAIAAVYPFFVAQSLLVLSEPLFSTLLVFGTWSLSLAYHGRGLKWSALAGLAFGLATLTRGSFLPVVFLAAVGWIAARRLDRMAIQKAFLMVGVFMLVMSPWVVRNWRVTGGHLVLTTLRVGPSLYEGLNDHADGGPMMDRINWDVGTDGMTEYERDRHWRREALRWAAEHPGRLLTLAGLKLVRFWNVVPNLEQFRGWVPCLAVGVPYGVVMLLAIVGLARSWRRREVWLLVLLPVVYYSIVHMVFVASVRYREALMPLVIVIAAHGVLGVWGRLRVAKAGERSQGAVAASGQ